MKLFAWFQERTKHIDVRRRCVNIPIPHGDRIAEHRWLRKVTRDINRPVDLYAPIGLHLIYRAWIYKWYWLVPLMNAGFYDLEPGACFWDGHFTLFFWRTLRKDRERRIQQ